MDADSLQKLREIEKIEDFVEFIKPYYPDLDIEQYTIEEIEKELMRVFVKIIGRILTYSPQNMRDFLKDYLLQYEIMNIKQIILGMIIGMSREQKSENVNFLVEEYLENSDFIKGLLEITSLDEVRVYMRGTKYYEAIREGILYFKNNNEIFVLEAFLDQLYYRNLRKREEFLNRKEKKMISLFIKIITEIYNLNLIYRGIINKIDKTLLSQFLVQHNLFLTKNVIEDLLNLENIDEFITKVREYFKGIEELKNFYEKIDIKEEHLRWSYEGLYIEYFFSKFKTKLDDIDYSTILQIFEILIKKEKEIRFDIMPNTVKIIHEKYKLLERFQK
ncbi:MAG: hypothetical protein EU539_04500 [Promethearchaeota archaeon]|nr:MAG: hypothetical protein EU539_04500 [Candidatus Lokiarchaeota archaeon]